jgi:hypothetical protein
VHALGETWWLFPVRDSSSDKAIARTCNDVLYETREAGTRDGFPSGAVAIASNRAGDLLVLLPDGNDRFRPSVMRWDHETREVSVAASDFEALRQVSPDDGDELVRLAPLHATPKGKRVLAVAVPSGPSVTGLPKPWRALALERTEKALYRLQLGKKAGCWLELHAGTLENEEWGSRWAETTELPPKGELRLEERTVTADGRQITVIAAWYSGWLPVLGWIIDSNGSWHGTFRSDTNRYPNDRREIDRLLERFAFGGE